MRHPFFPMAMVLALALLWAAPTAAAPLVSIIYSGNDFGEYRPCPT